jgi:hypothetical protein
MSAAVIFAVFFFAPRVQTAGAQKKQKKQKSKSKKAKKTKKTGEAGAGPFQKKREAKREKGGWTAPRRGGTRG